MVGQLVKKVKALELKLKTRSRKVVVSESDKEEEEEQDVDPLIKLAKAAAASDAPVNASPGADLPSSTHIPAGVFSGVSTGPSADPSNKGKSPMMRAEMQRKRQQDVLDSAKYYTDTDWTNIMGQVHANQGLTSDLLGPDVTEDNFAARMVALIAERRRAFAAQMFQEKRNRPMTYAQQKAYMRTFVTNQSSTIYTTGWSMKHVKSLSDEQLKSEFDKIWTAIADLQSNNLRRTLKRAVPPADSQQPSKSSSKLIVPSADIRSHSYGTRRKSLGTRKKSSTELDLDADDRSFIRVLFDDSDDDDDPVIVCSAFVTWEVVPTLLGDINALYRMDRSSKYFTHLREILHLVDRQDLLKLYGMVVRYYEDHPLAGAGMILSWRLFPFSNVHVLETISSMVVYMFVDGSYPLSVQLIKKMLEHKLEIGSDGVGNDMTHAEQLIQYIKNQIAASIPSA
ncbi:hypothetical protein Tco_1204024 [Tanacetum coccineum]